MMDALLPPAAGALARPVPTLALTAVTRRWRAGILGATQELTALDGCSLAVHPSEIAVVTGAAGSGKSTLLLIATGRLAPTQGDVRWEGRDEHHLVRPQLVAAKPWEYGFLTVRQALAYHADVLALHDAGLPAPTRFVPLMLRVGLRGMAKVRLGNLTPLGQFRVVLAQALLARPRLICCDDPFIHCGATEQAEGAALLRNLARSGLAIVVATRAPGSLLAIGERVRLYTLRLGRLMPAPAPHHHVLELAVPEPEAALTRLAQRLPSLSQRGRRLRVPLGGISPEAVLALCRDVGVPVRASRVAEVPVEEWESGR